MDYLDSLYSKGFEMLTTFKFSNYLTYTSCTVCGKLEHITSGGVYYWHPRFQYLDHDLYFTCTTDCTNQFKLTPIIYKPIDRHLYVLL